VDADGEFALVFVAAEFALDGHMRAFGDGAGKAGQFLKLDASMLFGARFPGFGVILPAVVVASDDALRLRRLRTTRSASSLSPVHDLGIRRRSENANDFRPAPVWTAFWTLCYLLITQLKCSVALCQMALRVGASTGLPTGSPKSSRKSANSTRADNGQRLARQFGESWKLAVTW